MRRLQIKFPSQIRISGWDFGSSARAMNQAGGKDSLMTYENESSIQADLRTVRKSTTERKIMSTKTSIKRIALVAVAGLGLGMVSTVSTNAAVLPNGTITAITGSVVTTTPTVGTAVYVKAGVTVAALAATGTADTVSITGALTSFPTGGSVAVSSNTAANATPAGTATPLATTASTATTSAQVGGELRVTTTATTAWSAQTVTYLGGYNFTPTKAGTYVLTIWNDTNGDSIVNANEVQQTVSITVAAAATFSTGTSSAYLVDGNGTTAGSSTSDALGARGSKTMSTANVAAITVSLKDSNNAAMASGNTITATISGAGGVGADTNDTPQASQCSATTVVRSVSLSADAVNTVYVCADGTAGTGTVTISVTNAAGVTSVLATKTVTFYGAVAKLAIDAQPMSILRAGGYQLGAITALDGLTATTIPAVVIKATDAGGNVVEGLTISAVSSNTSVIASSTTGEDTVANDADSVYGGPGYYVAHVTSATSSKSGDTATVTYRIVDPAGDGTTYLTAVATFTVGGSVSTETLTLDKSSYAPGEAMVITRTAKDSSGNPVYDGAAAPAVSGNKSFGGTLPAASFYIGGKKATSSTSPSVYAPAVEGEFLIKMTSGNAAATVISTTASVVVENASAAIDAANEATDAANAATDAANAAAEAADAATAAAQDAQAAVAALATQVSSLIAGIKAQITSLTNLVIKIQKKVRA